MARGQRVRDHADELRELLPDMVPHASRLAVMPPIVRRDFGPRSPGGKLTANRERYDAIIRRLIAEIRSDPTFDERNDVLTLMLQARYEDGSPISDDHVADVSGNPRGSPGRWRGPSSGYAAIRACFPP